MTEIDARAERFWTQVDQSNPDGCWPYMGYRLPNGYGQYGSVGAHRLAYQLHIGPIPAGLVVDHLCRNKVCVNPAHLEAVTQQENVRRALGSATRTHCTNGHELTDENSYIRKDRPETKGCRTCRAAQAAACYERKKAAA